MRVKLPPRAVRWLLAPRPGFFLADARRRQRRWRKRIADGRHS
jgi:hypothetical protein